MRSIDLRRLAWRIGVAIVGGSVLLLGILMIAAPGPGLLVIPASLTILATEFSFARRWLEALHRRTAAIGRRSAPPPTRCPRR